VGQLTPIKKSLNIPVKSIKNPGFSCMRGSILGLATCPACPHRLGQAREAKHASSRSMANANEQKGAAANTPSAVSSSSSSTTDLVNVKSLASLNLLHQQVTASIVYP